jgi:hypothetical protein
MRVPTDDLLTTFACLSLALLPFPSLAISSPLADSQDWPYNLPAGVKYHPEHEPHIKRNLEIQQRLNTAFPSGIRKMSHDEGEKFFLNYWQFEADLIFRRSTDSAALLANISNADQALLPPLLLHADSQQFTHLHDFSPRSLSKRAFQCPAGTSNCASIGQPNSCCVTGETCIPLSDSGETVVGCCPSGTTCGGQLGSCDIAAGQTKCENGGCCIPGYTCQGIGCELRWTCPLLKVILK